MVTPATASPLLRTHPVIQWLRMSCSCPGTWYLVTVHYLGSWVSSSPQPTTGLAEPWYNQRFNLGLLCVVFSYWIVSGYNCMDELCNCNFCADSLPWTLGSIKSEPIYLANGSGTSGGQGPPNLTSLSRMPLWATPRCSRGWWGVPRGICFLLS